MMTPAKRDEKRSPGLSTYAGANKAGGKARPTKAVLARRDVVADLKVRFRSNDQIDFIRAAACFPDPPESLNLFLATAALERAARILGKEAPGLGESIER